MTNDDKEFLENLKNELIHGNKCFQRFPQYWGIIVEKHFPVSDDYCDGWEFYDRDNSLVMGMHDDVDSVRKELLEDETISDILDKMSSKDILEFYNIKYAYDLCDFANKHFSKNHKQYDIVFYQKVEKIVEDVMFLTLKSCEHFIRLHHHNYGYNPRPYAMTATENKELERLLTIIMNEDWNQIT